jgi:hypothetical protein
MESNNSVVIAGKRIDDYKFYYSILGEKLYKTNIEVERISGKSDIIPVVISEKILTNEIKEADFLAFKGQIRTYNNSLGNVEVYFFAKELEIPEVKEHINQVELKGYVCKKADLRTTYSERKITSFIMAVNREYEKSDYLPVITWGKNAIYISNQDVSTKIKIIGRFQSRNYLKKNNEGIKEEKTTFEISSSQVLILEDN